MSKHLLFILFLLAFKQIQAQNELLNPGALGLDSFTVEMQMCDSELRTLQYWQMNAKNEKSSQQILSEWGRFFKKTSDFKESGFLTIRFIVNCKGEPRVHKFYEMDLNYQKKTFSDALKTQIWDFTKQLSGFKKGVYTYKDKVYDVNYYYYFIFKIENGEFQSIAP